MRRLLPLLVLAATVSPAAAERISNPIAVFAGLDKITGLTTTFEAKIGEEKRFGGLYVKADACYTRDVTEEPRTTSFVEVEEIESDDTRKKIFSGWMFAESPGLSAVEHPIYDVWLTGCRDPNAPPPVIEQAPDAQPTPDGQDDEPED
ncbi:MAG: DUF2155 domain-containing protein [Parvibaculaceae bacterium]